jgi:hypothetical protein
MAVEPKPVNNDVIALKLAGAVERLELSEPEFVQVKTAIKERRRLRDLVKRANRVLRYFRRAEHPHIADLADDIDQVMRKP